MHEQVRSRRRRRSVLVGGRRQCGSGHYIRARRTGGRPVGGTVLTTAVKFKLPCFHVHLWVNTKVMKENIIFVQCKCSGMRPLSGYGSSETPLL